MKRFANKSKFSPFYALLQLPEIAINSVHVEDHRMEILAQIKGKYGICPICGKKSSRVHGSYYRRLQDLSVFSKEVTIKLHVKKYVCHNSQCDRKIFSQQLPSGLDRYSRRTNRVNEQLTKMSLEVSARKSSWISRLSMIPVSPSTCLRLASKCAILPRDEIRHIGIDDWAYRKGHTYGTILVDRETGKAVDLIRSRVQEDIIRWLKAHPSIETVTRDRAECYSQSITSALPVATQIADRFHLVVNYSDYILRIVQKLLPTLIRIRHPKSASAGNANDHNIQRIIDLACGGQNSLAERKKKLILKAKKLYQQGYSKNRVAEILNLNFRTARKYIDHDLDQPIIGNSPRVDYSNYMNDLISGYCTGEKLSVIFRKIKKKGFRGTQRGLGFRFGTIYKEGKQNNGEATLSSMRRQHLHQTVSPRKLAIYLTNKNYNKILTPDEVDWCEKIREKNSLVGELWTLSKRFREMFEEKSIIRFREWVDQVMHSSFNSLKCFVKGLIRDFQAVKAAIINKDNNGQTEGNVNRLKNIKRQMYGRAGFELLRRKVVLSNTG
jgi:transposase